VPPNLVRVHDPLLGTDEYGGLLVIVVAMYGSATREVGTPS
jgi:hypothetical protein